MKLSDLKVVVLPGTFMRVVAEEHHQAYSEAYDAQKDWLCKFNTKLPSMSEGMWCLPITEEDHKKCTDDSSHGESVEVFCCNDSAVLPPIHAGVVLPLLTQGSERPVLDREKLVKQLEENGAPADVMPNIRAAFLGEPDE